MEGLTRLVLRHRWLVLGAWIVVFGLCGLASTQLSGLLTNRFTLPGTDTRRAERILEDALPAALDGHVHGRCENRRTGHGAGAARCGRRPREPPRSCRPAASSRSRRSPTTSSSRRSSRTSSRPTRRPAPTRCARPWPALAGAEVYVTGQAAIEHDLDPVLADDLARGELIAVPIALLILVFTFGTLAFLLPFAFTIVTIPTTLGIVWVFANFMELTTYLTNLVTLIGLGIAIDYSLLVVYRYREELRRGSSRDEAIVTTMATAGRAVVFSGTAVAIGLALLLFMPLPFIRGFGVGGLIIPAVSVAAAVTFLPVLLSLVGRPLDRVRLLPASWLDHRADHEHGFWARLARFIMRYPKLVAGSTSAFLILLTLPVLALELGPGSNEGIPRDLEAIQGYEILGEAVGAGATAPAAIVVDTGRAGGVGDPEVVSALAKLGRGLDADPEVAAIRVDRTPQHVDPTGRYLNVEVVGVRDYGDPASLAFVDRLRDEIIPAAGFPESTVVYAGGGPPGGKDFIDLTYSWFPWLVLAVLVATFFLLMRAFRSIVLPLKAIILNLLSIGAAYGLLVIVFKWGAGEWIGLIGFDQIEAWIPVMLFAMLFGLSMDYEVFLVSRMREEWDNGATNEEAVVLGLTKTGRLVTAAGLIMFAAFMGLIAGSVVGLQQFGFGLAAAILIDVTIIRALLVPSAMTLFGKWNWWLPEGLARIVRVEPSPLGEHRRSAPAAASGD